MSIICENYVGSTEKLKYSTVENFVFAFPSINPNTPLGSAWKFEPCFLPALFNKYKDEIENYAVRSDDVWSITCPKAGSTWSQEMIWLLNNNLNYEEAKQKSIMDRFLFLEIDSVIGGLNYNVLEISKKVPSPRHIKSHLPAGLLPKQLWTVKPKIIYTARGVKDSAISFYHHYVHLQGYEGSLNDFLEAFLDNKVIFAPFHSHIKDFWYLRNEENILFITYEEMKTDLMSVIKKTSKFLGKNFSDQDLQTLATHLSFNSMKKNPNTNFSQDSKMKENLGKIHSKDVTDYRWVISKDF